MAAEARRVVVFGMGGTIAMTPGSTGGAVPSLAAEDLVAAVPGLAEAGIGVEVEDFRRLPGASLELDDLAALAAAIEERLESGVDGVVVTQGTDTMEETAYLLDLWHTGPQPVVVTGAMRTPAQAGADGPANLLAAVQVAASDTVSGEGALVVLGGEIHAARRVRKAHTTSTDAFTSPNGGPLGFVVEGEPRILNRLERRIAMPRPDTGPWPRVGLATVVLADDGALLEGAADHLDGLVVAGFGVGHVPERLVSTLEALAGRIPVVLASRTGAGAVLAATYGFPGSERDLLNRGLIGSGFLDPLKARILLLALLAAKSDRTTISAAFEAIGGTASDAVDGDPSDS